MNWKEFFKPAFAKIGIFFTFFIGSIFIRGIVTQTGSEVLAFVEKIVAPHYFIQTLTIARGAPDIAISPLDLIFIVFGFVIGLAYWYFMSSLIVWIYRRYKK